jgi:hypothetical protein
MTVYSENLFTGATGVLEHLILAVIAQKLANRGYLPSSLETDFTAQSINWQIISDSAQSREDSNAMLEINVTLPIIPYDSISLSNTDPDISRRLLSINSTNIDTLSISKEDTYDQKSLSARYPEYLNDFTSDNYLITNTLERRIFNLCLQILSYERWEEKYNAIIDKLYFHYLVSLGGYDLPENIEGEGELEAQRQDLIAMLQGVDPLPLELPIIFNPIFPPGASTDGGSGSASGLGDFFGGSDPANAPKLSESLLDLLNSANTADLFGSASDGSPSNNRPEVPTLADC